MEKEIKALEKAIKELEELVEQLKDDKKNLMCALKKVQNVVKNYV